MPTLDDHLALTRIDENAWSIRAHPEREANTGMFGGWTAAVLLKAALSHAEAEGTPVAFTANFISRIDPGTDIIVRGARLGGGKSLKSWRADITDASGGLCATASIVTATRRDSDRFLEGAMPPAPAPETIPMAQPPARFGATIDMRPVAGFPPFSRPDTRSLAYVRETSGRAMDRVQLAYLADVAPPRVFYISNGPRPSSTITMSVYFYATDAELASVGTGFVLSEVAGVRAEGSTNGLMMRLWSPEGALLATSEQLCWFR